MPPHDIGSTSGVRFNAQAALTACPDFHRLIVEAAEELSGADVVAAKLPEPRRRNSVQGESIDVAHVRTITTETIGGYRARKRWAARQIAIGDHATQLAGGDGSEK